MKTVRQAIGEGNASDLAGASESASPATTGPVAAPVTTSRPRVLVVDDEPEMREMIAEFLVDEGFDAVTAPNVLSAFVALLEKKPDLLVVDWIMPALDGFELLRAVELLHPELPVIFMSAYVQPEVSLLAAAKGAFAVLSKPFTLAGLLVEVRDALRPEPTRRRRHRRRPGRTATASDGRGAGEPG